MAFCSGRARSFFGHLLETGTAHVVWCGRGELRPHGDTVEEQSQKTGHLNDLLTWGSLFSAHTNKNMTFSLNNRETPDYVKS